MISQSSHTLGVRGLGVDSMEIIYGGKLARENESQECEANASVRWHIILNSVNYQFSSSSFFFFFDHLQKNRFRALTIFYIREKILKFSVLTLLRTCLKEETKR